MIRCVDPRTVFFVTMGWCCIEWSTGKPESVTGGTTMAIFTNQATLTYNNNIINSNITTGEIREVLTITKNAVLGTYGRDDDVTYVINIRNTGTLPFTGLTLTDDLGAYTAETLTLVPLTYADGSLNYFVNGVSQPSPAVTAGPPLTVSGITVPAGGTATILYTARANGFAPLDTESSITNSVTLSGGGILPITDSETVNAAAEADLTISKSLCPAVVTENGQITYTFVIQNTGNTPVVATDNAVINDTFDPALTDLTVTFNGTVWSAPANYTYSPATGVFATNPGQITVPAATFSRNETTGEVIIQPGISTLTVTGTI